MIRSLSCFQVLQGIIWLSQSVMQSNILGIIFSILLLLLKTFEFLQMMCQNKQPPLLQQQIQTVLLLILMSLLSQNISLKIDTQIVLLNGIFMGLQMSNILQTSYHSKGTLMSLSIIYLIQLAIFGVFNNQFKTFLSIIEFLLCVIIVVFYFVDHLKIKKTNKTTESQGLQNFELYPFHDLGVKSPLYEENNIQQNIISQKMINSQKFFTPSKKSLAVRNSISKSSAINSVIKNQYSSRFIKINTQKISNSLYQNQPSLQGQHIFNVIPQAFIILNKQKQIIYFNRKAERLFKTDNSLEILQQLRLIFFQTNLLTNQDLLRRKQSLNRNIYNSVLVPNTLTQQQFDMLLRMKHRNKIPAQFEVLDFLLDPCSPDVYHIIQLISQTQAFSISKSFSYDHNTTLIYESEYYQEKSQKNLNLQIQIIQGEFGTVENELELLDQRLSQESDKYNIVIMIDDVTKKRNFIEVQKQLKFQHEILLSFSHELRTPLNCAIQLLNVAQDIVSHEIYQKLIRPAQNSNLLLLHQINDILDYAAFETQDFHYKFTTFQFRDIYKEIKELFELAMRQKEIAFNIVAQNDLMNQNFSSDKQRLIQVLRSLMINSIKFTQTGGWVELFFKKCLTQKGQQQQYKIGIRDNGPGITLTQLNQMQIQLKNYSKNTQNQFQIQDDKLIGLGYKTSNRLVSGLCNEQNHNYLRLKPLRVGLQVSFRLIDQQDNLDMQQKDKQLNDELDSIFFFPQTSIVLGTEKKINFGLELSHSISFPNLTKSIHLIQSNNCDSMREDQIQQVKTNKGRAQIVNTSKQCKCNSILIVDDEPFNQLALKELLRSYNTYADSTYDGQQAINQVKENCNKSCCQIYYKIILMDIQMPIKNGLEATKEILEYYLQFHEDKRPAIIMCSAFDTKKNMLEAEQVGIVDYLNKPIRKKLLEELLCKYGLVKF